MLPSRRDGWLQNHQIPTRTHPHLRSQPHYPSPTSNNNFYALSSYSSIIMSSHSQITRSPPSNVTPSEAPPIVIFELNQARRAKVTRELETVRSGMLSVCPQHPELDLHKSLSHAYRRCPNYLQHSWTGRLWRGSKHLSRRGLSTAR